jgi:hypothetical protein
VVIKQVPLICPLIPLLIIITPIQYRHPLANPSIWDSTCKEAPSQPQYKIFLAIIKILYHLFQLREVLHKWPQIKITKWQGLPVVRISMILVRLLHSWLQVRCHHPSLAPGLRASQSKSSGRIPSLGFPKLSKTSKTLPTTEKWIKHNLGLFYCISY